MDNFHGICPFCDGIFDQTKIKDHIASKHLGILPKSNNLKTENDKLQESVELKVSKNNRKCEYCGKTISEQIFQKHWKKCEIIFETK